MTTSDQGTTSTSNDSSKAGANTSSTQASSSSGESSSQSQAGGNAVLEATIKENQQLKARLAEIEKNQKTEKESSLANKEDFKGLLKLREQELEETKNKLNTLANGLVTSKKMEAIKQEALKHGIRPEMLGELKRFDWSNVVTAVNDGDVEVHGASTAVEQFKRKFEFMFSGKAPNINTSKGSVQETSASGTKEITIKDLNEAEAAAKKSGDDSDYRAKLLAFKKQEMVKQPKFQ